MCAVKPKRSRSGPVSAPDRVVAPTRVKGATSSGIDVAPGPFPDDHVDAEVLHREVQHLLGGPGDAVDLVDEQHVVLDQVGQHRGQVAGALQRRPRRQAQRRAEFGGDDHRQ